MKPRKNPAAVSLGRKGGKAGTGTAKARSSAVAKAAALKRWKTKKAAGPQNNGAVERRGQKNVMTKTDLPSLPATSAEASQGASPGVPTGDLVQRLTRRRFVTVVYEIVNDAQWRGDGNPLHYEHHGLKSVCVSAGDLASLVEDLEAHIRDDGDNMEAKYDELHTKHVMSSFPGR